MIKIKSYRNLILIILFLVTLSSPALLQISHLQLGKITTENRSKTKFPVFKIKKPDSLINDFGRFVNAFDNYYKDNFAFRDLLIMVYRNIKLGLLKTDPFPNKVVAGRDGWLFLGDASSKVISETKGLLNFSEQELEQITKNVSDGISFLDSANISFFLAIAPEKSTVYGEYLPILKSGNPTKLEQVRERLLKLGCRIIDLKEDFSQMRLSSLYYKTDSHWNEFGEFSAYQTLMKRLKSVYSNLTILQQDDFSIDTVYNYLGDLNKLLFLPGTDHKYVFTQRDKQEIIEKEKIYSIPATYTWNPANYERRFSNEKKELKILVFHDSYFLEFPKFLTPGFKETVFIWSIWRKKIILNEKPDIVIFEKAERELDHLLYRLK